MNQESMVENNDETARLVYADWWQEQGRDDVAAMWRGTLPVREGTRDRIDSMTDAERAKMAGWAEDWIRIGLCTDPADRPMFEAGVTQCYLAAGLNPPRVVWCPNPLVTVLAGSQYALRRGRAVDGVVSRAVDVAVNDAVGRAVDVAVGHAVDVAVHGAVDVAVGRAVDVAVDVAVGRAVRDAVDGAVDVAVRDAVNVAVNDAVNDAVRDAVRDAVNDAVTDFWWRRFGGQFWVGGWWGGPAYTMFMLDVILLKIPAHLELAARAYAATCKSACWWYPTGDCVFVSERPSKISDKAVWDGFEALLPKRS